MSSLSLCQGGRLNKLSSVAVGTVLCLSVLGGCGLQRTVFLYPPEQSSIQSGLADGIASFEHNTENLPDEIRGYEIYYKLYGVSTEQEAKIDQEENSILDPDSQALLRLESLDFVRLRLRNEPLARPLIFIPFDERTNSIVFTIDFSGVSDNQNAFFEWENSEGDTISQDLWRTIESGVSGGYRDFTGNSEDYAVAEHDDIDDGAEDINPNGLQLVAYVLAYGEDLQDFTPVYSFEARRLYQPPFDGLLP